MKFQVLIRLKAGVLDVQGKAIENGVTAIGFSDVSNVRVGKLIELEVGAKSLAEARDKTEELCRKLLANPIIEDFEIREL